METELREIDPTWGEAGEMDKDRDGWREFIAALCLTGAMRLNERVSYETQSPE